ncbi:MAG: hypothetical protein ACE5JF_06375 [Anaerolineales bacterium]
MSFRRRGLWVPFVLAGFALAGCNFPTPTMEAPTETAGATLVEPTASPGDVPPDPTATAASTSEAAVVPTDDAARNLRVAYTDDGNLWVVEQGSEPSQLTDSGGITEVRLSDDGEWIAYAIRDSDQDTAELHSIRFDGSGSQVLLDGASFDALYPLEFFVHYTLSSFDFLPRSHMLLFNTRGVFEGPGLAKNDDLIAVDVATGQISPLLSRGDGGDFTSSPGGGQIVIVRADSLGFVDADGANLRPEVLTFPSVITYSEYFFYPLPVWSDSSVVLPVPQEDPFFAAEPGTVWSVNGEAQAVAQPDGDLFAPQRELPIVSPDGMHLAYFQSTDEAGEQHLVIQRLDTGEQIIYDTGSLQWKGWAPDSYHFAYTKGSGLDLYLGDLLGVPEPLGSGTGLRWVNAEEYLYLAGNPNSWTLTLADLEGSKIPLAIASDGAYDFAE